MIPDPQAPILERLGLNGDGWLETVRHFGRWFKRAAGHRDSLVALATRTGRQWFQGQRAPAIAFRSPSCLPLNGETWVSGFHPAMEFWCRISVSAVPLEL